MKTTKEKADELVEQFNQRYFDEDKEKVYHAINAVKYTIKVLEIELSELSKNRQEYEFSMWVLENLISEQTELLIELESRL